MCCIDVLAHFFLRFEALPVFHIDSKPFRGQEPEPLQSLGVQTNFSERIVPVRKAQVHDHQSEVISECIGDEIPLAREVLEPDLRLGGLVAAVDQG